VSDVAQVSLDDRVEEGIIHHYGGEMEVKSLKDLEILVKNLNEMAKN
jgi:hypothetical protein